MSRGHGWRMQNYDPVFTSVLKDNNVWTVICPMILINVFVSVYCLKWSTNVHFVYVTRDLSTAFRNYVRSRCRITRPEEDEKLWFKSAYFLFVLPKMTIVSLDKTLISPSRKTRLCDRAIYCIISQSPHIYAGLHFFQIRRTFAALITYFRAQNMRGLHDFIISAFS